MQWLIDILFGMVAAYFQGMILMWSGAIIDIPDGWVLCDGNNGTPDLRNKFVPGAGDTYAVDAEGGSITHIHNFVGDDHDHTIIIGKGLAAGLDFEDATDKSPAAGVTDSFSTNPLYYALAYIMKT